MPLALLAEYTSCVVEARLIIVLLIGILWLGSIVIKQIIKP